MIIDYGTQAVTKADGTVRVFTAEDLDRQKQRDQRKRALQMAGCMPYCEADPFETARRLAEYAGNDEDRWELLGQFVPGSKDAAHAIESVNRALDFINGRNPPEAPASA